MLLLLIVFWMGDAMWKESMREEYKVTNEGIRKMNELLIFTDADIDVGDGEKCEDITAHSKVTPSPRVHPPAS